MTGKIASLAYFFLIILATQRMAFVFRTDAFAKSGAGGDAEDLPSQRLMFVVVICIFLFYPNTHVINYHFSNNVKDADTRLRQFRDYFALYILFILLTFFSFIVMVICNESLTIFYLTSTTLTQRLVLRGPVLFLMVALSTSGSCHASHALITRFDVNRQDASFVFVAFTTITAIFGRLMQTSADTVGEAVLFNFVGEETWCREPNGTSKRQIPCLLLTPSSGAFSLVGTATELFALDGFLQGEKSIQELKELLCVCCGNKKLDEVNPEQDDGGEKQRGESGEWNLEDTKRVFCAQAIITHSIIETMSLVVCTVMALSLRLNSGGKPGDRKLYSGLILTNLVIMLVGKVVVSDGLVQLIARTFKKRYVMDPEQGVRSESGEERSDGAAVRRRF